MNLQICLIFKPYTDLKEIKPGLEGFFRVI